MWLMTIFHRHEQTLEPWAVGTITYKNFLDWCRKCCESLLWFLFSGGINRGRSRRETVAISSRLYLIMSENPTPPKEENKPMMIMGAPENNGNENAEIVELPNQPRPARDMKGLLRFAMEATAMEDAPSSSDFQPMDVEVMFL